MCWAPPSRSTVAARRTVDPDCTLLVPEALHHELEIRRLDPRAVLRAFDRPEPAERRLDLAGADLVENALDELGLDDHRLAGQLGVAFEPAAAIAARAALRSRRSRRRVFPNRPGNATGEAIELRERVLSQ